jgi:hypothetical protein
VARTTQGHAESLRDLSKALFLETRKLQRGALPFGQLRKARSDDPPTLVAGQMLPVPSNRRLNSIERFTCVRGAPAEHVPAPQASPIGVLEEPHAHGAARRIVQMRFSINLEKYFLCDVFGLSFVPEDVDRHAVDQSNVSAEQCPQRVAVWQVHFGDEVGVRLLTADAALASVDMASHRSDP